MAEKLTIARLGHRGDGIAETATGPVFIPYTLPGESVEVEPAADRPDRRQLVKVDRASAERIAPICPHFGACGGCAAQHWAATNYRQWKGELVITALAQAGIDAPVAPLVDAHGEGRRRAVFHARRDDRDIITVGFAAARTHRIVPIDQCPILAPGMTGAIAAAGAIAEALDPARKPLDIQVTASDCGLDIDVRGSGPLSAEQSFGLAKVAEHHGLARLTRHGELVAQRTAPTIRIGRAHVALPPGAFLQATQAGEATLAELVIDALDGAKNIADLFAGVGPFALRLAERRRVFAIDNNADAIAALTRAAATTTALKPITAQVRDLFRRPLVVKETAAFDAVVFDPPRQGAQAQARELAISAVPVIVAVSCNPATFARDARILIEGGCRLTMVTPVDQFRYSAHVEVVGKFER